MEMKAVSGVMLTLLLMGMLALAFNIQPAKSEWTGTVYIRADGSIDPPDAPIHRDGNVYTLTDNITSSKGGIVVGRDNIIIDGAGYVVNGSGTDDIGYIGLSLGGRKNVVVKNINVKNFVKGIYVWDSVNITLYRNNITNNADGVQVTHSTNIKISGNNIINNENIGVYIGFPVYVSQRYTNCNKVFRNYVANNNYGICIEKSSNNTVIANLIIENNKAGIHLWTSYNNNISANNIISNRCGIYLGYSSNNRFCHNNIVNNTYQAYSFDSMINIWDDGYPSGGNYWSDYAGVDADGDGIGNTPYVIDVNNVDRYPLTGPFSSFNTSVGCSVDVISNSTIEDFRYFEFNSTIVMHVSNMTANQTFGFCRLTIPHKLMQPPYIVEVNGTMVEYETIYENYTEGISIIYFTYEHSRLEIAVIPEFPSTILLLASLMLLAIPIIFARKHSPRKTTKPPHFYS